MRIVPVLGDLGDFQSPVNQGFGDLVREIPDFSGKPRLVKYYDLAHLCSKKMLGFMAISSNFTQHFALQSLPSLKLTAKAPEKLVGR